MLKRSHKRGQSVIEFAALTVFILATFLVFQKYIVRGFSGRWKQVGDTMGQGRIFDPNKTVECRYATFFEGNPGRWFNQTCFEEMCVQDCLKTQRKPGPCDACLEGCASDYCS